jgi:hypothetical protein
MSKSKVFTKAPLYGSPYTRTQVEVTAYENVSEPGIFRWKCGRVNKPGVKGCHLDYVRPNGSYVAVQQKRSNAVPVFAAVPNPGAKPPVDLYVDSQDVELERLSPLASVPQGYGRVVPVMTFRGPTNITRRMGGVTAAGSRSGASFALAKDEKSPAVPIAPMIGGNTYSQGNVYAMLDRDWVEQNLNAGPLGVLKNLPDGWDTIFDQYKTYLKSIDKEGKQAIAFLTTDAAFGSKFSSMRSMGFPFPERFLPPEIYTNPKIPFHNQYKNSNYPMYWNWLVTVMERLRAIRRDLIGPMLVDKMYTTVAILEGVVLVSLGKLETYGVMFKRDDLFYGYTPFQSIMDDTLRKYITAPASDIWESPLHIRHLFGTGKEDPDKLAITFLAKVAETIQKDGTKAGPGASKEPASTRRNKTLLKYIFTVGLNMFVSSVSPFITNVAEIKETVEKFPLCFSENGLLSILANVQLYLGVTACIKEHLYKDMFAVFAGTDAEFDKRRIGNIADDAGTPNIATSSYHSVAMHLHPVLIDFFDAFNESVMDESSYVEKNKTPSAFLVDLPGLKRMRAKAQGLIPPEDLAELLNDNSAPDIKESRLPADYYVQPNFQRVQAEAATLQDIIDKKNKPTVQINTDNLKTDYGQPVPTTSVGITAIPLLAGSG